MKIYNLSVLGLTSVLASCAFARPEFRVSDDADPLPQKSRMTAFRLEDSGLVLECWEIDSLLPTSDQQMTPKRGSKGTPRVMQMGVGEGGVAGVDIVTWSGPTTIWPPPEFSSYAVDLTAVPSLFTVKNGMVVVRAGAPSSKSVMESEYVFIFGIENGDDWFNFEDNRSDSGGSNRGQHAKGDPPQFTMSTASSTETTLIRFKYKTTPEHKVLHTGPCNFAGLKPESEGATDKDLPSARLTVQEL